jgi:hypothetical protein
MLPVPTVTMLPVPTVTMLPVPTVTMLPEPSATMAPHPRKKVTGGGYFLIVVGSAVFLYVAGGVTIGYCYYDECGCPSSRFWREFFICLVWGVKALLCMKPWRSGPDTMWAYATVGGYECV